VVGGGDGRWERGVAERGGESGGHTTRVGMGWTELMDYAVSYVATPCVPGRKTKLRLWNAGMAGHHRVAPLIEAGTDLVGFRRAIPLLVFGNNGRPFFQLWLIERILRCYYP
jgi:hypothetical protein